MLAVNEIARAYEMMTTARVMGDLYENNRATCKYVHSTSRGHEAIQVATGLQLLPCDFVSPYYRDDCMLLTMGFTPYELMLQLLAKADDPFSGGRSYYCHPGNKDRIRPGIIHQSSATGMQAIPTTGIAQGIRFLEDTHSPYLRKGPGGEQPIVVCSFGDNSITEGEVSEALQFAALKQLPILYLVQDNQWGISVTAAEARAMNAYEYADGFKGLHKMQVDGSDFIGCYIAMQQAVSFVRQRRKPLLVHASVPLLGHHTSGVRKETYRSKENLDQHARKDPYPDMRRLMLMHGYSEEGIAQINQDINDTVNDAFNRAVAAADPAPETVEQFVFAETPVTEEKGIRTPEGRDKVMMVDAALHAIEEIMNDHPESLLYGQDVGKRLGGVFREAATLGEKFGEKRVFNTAIQEAYIIGSTIGMAALGLKPIVEVQFADYIYPGLNQLVTEISKSSYLSGGKFPVSMVLRVPTGAYGGGGPYHSGSIETTLLSVKGIKVVYPSNAADMKGLMKAAFYDPNPVVILEHKGLYWSKVPGTEGAKTVEPDKDYILPLGKAAITQKASSKRVASGESVCVITWGMGVYKAKAGSVDFACQVEIVDLRTLYPLDETLVFETVKKHGRCLVLTEEPQNNSFAEALAYRISKACFTSLDAPVEVLGALNLPAVPINIALEAAMIPGAEAVKERLQFLLNA